MQSSGRESSDSAHRDRSAVEVEGYDISPVGTADGYYDPRFDLDSRGRRAKVVKTIEHDEPPESDEPALAQPSRPPPVIPQVDPGEPASAPHALRSVFSPDRPPAIDVPRVRVIAEPYKPPRPVKIREPRESFRRLRPVVSKDSAGKVRLFTVVLLLIAAATAAAGLGWWSARPTAEVALGAISAGRLWANSGILVATESPATALLYGLAFRHANGAPWALLALGLLAPVMAGLAVAGVYAAVRTVGGAFYGVLAAILFIVGSGVLLEAANHSHLASATALSTLGIAFLLRWWRTAHPFVGVASGVFLMGAIAFEPAMIAIVATLLFASVATWEWTKPAPSAVRAAVPVASFIVALVVWQSTIGGLNLRAELAAVSGAMQELMLPASGSAGVLAVAIVGALTMIARRPALGIAAALWMIGSAFVAVRSGSLLPIWPPILFTASYGLWRVLHAPTTPTTAEDETRSARMWREISTPLVAGGVVAIAALVAAQPITGGTLETDFVRRHQTLAAADLILVNVPEGAVVIYDSGDLTPPMNLIAATREVTIIDGGSDLAKSIQDAFNVSAAIGEEGEAFLLVTAPGAQLFESETLPSLSSATATEIGRVVVDGYPSPWILLHLRRVVEEPETLYFAHATAAPF